ncbi:MAG: tetratricopeptide repeat protein [Candidatus Heimdallarchaeota archaeon]|nr:tetratricopeptide repeat protein [Candidatus Heimdallarchaeota archaeon]
MDVTGIQTLIDTGKFEEAILATDKLTHNQLEGKLYKSIAYALLGDFQLGNDFANSVLQEAKANKNRELEFAALTSIANIKLWRGDPDLQTSLNKTHAKLARLSAIKDHRLTYWVGFLYFVEGIFGFAAFSLEKFENYNERLKKITNDLNWNFLKCFLKYTQTTRLILSGNIDSGIPELQNQLDQISNYDYKLLEGYIHSSVAALYLIAGDFEKYRDFVDSGAKIWKEIKFAMGEIYYHGGIGLYYLNMANLTLASSHYQMALKISDQLGTRMSLGAIYRFTGEIHYRRGELKEALVSYQKSLKIRQESNDILGSGDSYAHLGKIYQEFGDLEFALENYVKGLEKRKSINFISGVASSYDLIGKVHIEMNELESANEYFNKSLGIKRKLGNEFSIAATLFNQIRIHLELDTEMVQSLFDELQSINNKLENKHIDLYTKLAEALILKNSTRGLKKSQAQLILLDLVQMKMVDHGLTVIALLNLTEILLWELKSSGNKEILSEIDDAITKLVAIAKSQNIPSLFVKTYLFKSKLALLNLEFDKAKEHLNKAQEIAVNKGLRYLAIMVSNELDALLKQIDKWEELVQKELPFDQVVELTQFEHILKRINPQEDENIIPEEPVLLLILGEGGITIFSHKFRKLDIKEELVGSFLSAINTFGKETFSPDGSIERIIHQNYTILIKAVSNFLFCFIINGNSYSAIQKFDAFIDSVQASAIWGELVGSSNILKNELLVTLQRICDDLFIYDQPPIEISQITTSSKTKPVDDTEYLEVPTELLSYKFLLNPVRLSIVKILNSYYRYPAAELRKLLGIPWGTFNDHLEALSKKGFIESQKEFIKETPRNILYLTSAGESEYSSLKSILRSVIAI